MAKQNINFKSFEYTPPDSEMSIDLAYTTRENQVSIIITQDSKKEGILSFFENLNYNHIVEQTTSSPQESTTSTSSMQSTQSTRSSQPTGMY